MATRISTPFGFSSTVMEVIEGIDLKGKRAVITGGTIDLYASLAEASGARVVSLSSNAHRYLLKNKDYKVYA